MRRKPADVPLAKDVSDRFLPWLVAFMVYFVALAAVGATTIHEVVAHWDKGLSGQLTVEIPPPAPDASETERRERIDSVIRILTRTGGVEEVTLYGDEDIAELLEPWLGGGLAEQDLPLPEIIAVTIDTDAPPALAPLAEQLEAAVPGTLLDDHKRWLGKLLDLALFVQIFAGVIVLLVGAIAVMAVVFVTRTGLSVHREVIEILHLIGARDHYIARQFQRHALMLGLRGGVIGSVLAVATLLAVGQALGPVESALPRVLSLSLVEWGLLALLPVVTAAVAMITARLTVLGTLARMP
jgi:cell division transport system permease protein